MTLRARHITALLTSAAICWLAFPGRTRAQDIQITGGNISMTVSSAVIGQEPAAVTDVSVSLRYRRQTFLSKITVATICPGQRFNLSVVALSAGSGTVAPAANLTNGMLATDLIVNIPAKPPANFQTANLQYTASATFAQGNSTELGNDVHTVTYTIIAQ